MNRVVVIGGGVGGLTTAALLARSGLEVTVLEARVNTGGPMDLFGLRVARSLLLELGLLKARPNVARLPQSATRSI